MLGENGLGPANLDYASTRSATTSSRRPSSSRPPNSKLTPAAPGWAAVEGSGILEEFFGKVAAGGDIEALAAEYDEKIDDLSTAEPSQPMPRHRGPASGRTARGRECTLLAAATLTLLHLHHTRKEDETVTATITSDRRDDRHGGASKPSRRRRAPSPTCSSSPRSSILLFGMGYPLVWQVVTSLQKFGAHAAVRQAGPDFVGLDNYIALATDPDILGRRRSARSSSASSPRSSPSSSASLLAAAHDARSADARPHSSCRSRCCSPGPCPSSRR